MDYKPDEQGHYLVATFGYLEKFSSK
jgi:hypothetical protein